MSAFNEKSGFTMVELLVVLAVISLLVSMVIASLRVAKLNGMTARTKADLYTLRTAVLDMEGDTAQLPGHMNSSSCTENGATLVTLDNSTSVGLVLTDGNYPNWKGPYVPSVPPDPWLTSYKLDKWYTCNGGVSFGCAGIPNGTRVRAIVSYGPDKVQGNDDILVVLCK